MKSTSGEYDFMERLGRLWCRLMHESVMWPIDGHYQCTDCLRQFAVDWDERSGRVGLAQNAAHRVARNQQLLVRGYHPSV